MKNKDAFSAGSVNTLTIKTEEAHTCGPVASHLAQARLSPLHPHSCLSSEYTANLHLVQTLLRHPLGCAIKKTVADFSKCLHPVDLLAVICTRQANLLDVTLLALHTRARVCAIIAC